MTRLRVLFFALPFLALPAATQAETMPPQPVTAHGLTAPVDGLDILLDTIAIWLARNFDLPLPDTPPRLALAPAATLVTLRYGPGSAAAPGEVAAVYLDAESAIYLADDWTGRTPADLSVLVHEMVHHLQADAGMRFACPGAREEPAYHAQDAWLALFGESLESAFEIDAMTLMLRTTCGY
jgi:hypothetical protein